jgi:hypothetical protein
MPIADRGSTGSSAPFWITLGSTVALAGGAATFAVLARDSDDELERELGRFPADPQRVAGARSELRRNSLLADGLTVGAAVSGAFCVYFAIAGGGGSGDRRPVSVELSPGRVTARGRF